MVVFSVVADPLAPAAAADEDEARVARLARGDVPLQQPAARRALPDDPLGRALPDPLRGGARRDALGLEAVLRLLPPHVRAAAAAADGDRAARGVAEGVAPLAREDVHHPVRRGVDHRRGAARCSASAARGPGCSRTRSRAFVAASIVLEFVRGRAAAGGIFRLIARNRRRYGGYIVHAAIVLLAIGIAGSSAYQTAAGADPAARAVDRGRRLHAHVHGADRRERPGLHRLPRARRRVRSRRALPAPSGDEQLRHRGSRERGVDLPRPALARRRLHDGRSS